MEMVVSREYNGNLCDFYEGEGREVYLTREQIGTALGYVDSIVAIGKIHSRHKHRLDKFSVKTRVPILQTGKLGENKGVEGNLKSQIEELEPRIGELGFQVGKLSENKGVEGNLFYRHRVR